MNKPNEFKDICEGDLTESEKLVHSFIRVNHMHRAAVESKVDALGMHRSQHMLMISIAKSATPPTQKEMADKLEISPAAVAVALKKLESAGFICREAENSDNRCNRIKLTEYGSNMLDETHRLFSEIDARMFSGFSPDELKKLSGFLDRMKDNISEILPEKPFYPGMKEKPER